MKIYEKQIFWKVPHLRGWSVHPWLDQSIDWINQLYLPHVYGKILDTVQPEGGGGGGTAIYLLYRDVPPVRVYNFIFTCPGLSPQIFSFSPTSIT